MAPERLPRFHFRRWSLTLAGYFILVVLLLSPFLFRMMHSLPPAITLKSEHQENILSWIRQQVQPLDTAAVDARTLPELAAYASHPVWITVYDESYPGLPLLGSSAARVATLSNALHTAVDALRDELRQKNRTISPWPQSRIKVDIGGEAKAVWSNHPAYLESVLDPGRDGLLLKGNSRIILPSWIVEQQLSPQRIVAMLIRESDPELVGSPLQRFRTLAFVEGAVATASLDAGSVDAIPAHELFRGNVLIQEVTPQTLMRSITLAGSYLARMIGPDGRYCYDYQANRDECGRDYNLLRHAGTTYSLYQILEVAPSREIFAAADRATGWLRRQVRQVSSDSSRAYLIEGKTAKLGAVGLAMLALVERERRVGDGMDLELLQKMANFVASQQRADGYLESYFKASPDARMPNENSIYYPGEATLGLIRLHALTPTPPALEVAWRAAAFLAKQRWRWAGIELYVPPDAWLTQALAELYGFHRDDVLKDYCYSIIDLTEDTMLRDEEGAPADMAGGPANGLFLPNVTPAGSRSEGLNAAYQMALLSGDSKRAQSIRDLLMRSAKFQLSQQFREETTYFLPNPRRALGGFRSRADKLDVRIDYVQHNMTGLIGLLKIIQNERMDAK